MGKANATERGGMLTSNNSSDSPTGSGYNTDVSDDNLPCDRISPSSDLNGNSVSDEQVGEFLIIIVLWKIENYIPNSELISGVYLFVFPYFGFCLNNSQDILVILLLENKFWNVGTIP